MHVDLIATTKGDKLIHGTDNGKKTACGINLTKPENLGKYTTAGEMNDIMQLTCEKCKITIAKKQIKEANKEMAAQLKAEQKAMKRERALEKHNHGHAAPPPPPAEDSKSGAYTPPSMRKSMAEQEKQRPIDAPAPEIPKPASMPAPNVAPTPVPAPAPAPVPKDDVLAQFAIPTVPTSVPGAAPPPAAPAPAPAPAPVDDVLAQFAIPTVPTSLPGTTPPPVTPALAPAPVPADDVLAQFAIPTVPTSLPGKTPPPAMPEPKPVSAPADDVLAQFAIPTVPTSLPGTAVKPAAGNAEDLLAQFSVPKPGAQPAPAPAPAPMTSQEDILAQFSQKPAVGDVIVETPDVEAIPSVKSAVGITDAAEEIIDAVTTPVSDDFDPFAALRQPTPPPAPASAVSDSLDDLMVVPAGMKAPEHMTAPDSPVFPKLAEPTVPTAPTAPQPMPTLTVPSVPAAASAAVPTLEVPPVPPAPPVPEMPVPPTAQPVYPTAAMPQGYGLPAMPQGFGIPQPMPGYPQMPFGQVPVQPVMAVPGYPYPVPAAPQSNFFAVPPAAKKTSNTKPPLFVGYSADGRQLFQTYDEDGNPIPINEAVYSAPPEQPKNQPAPTSGGMPASGAPVMDLDDLMASMGIEDPKKKKRDEGKAINYTEYHIPEKKKKKPAAASVPASAMPDITAPTGPVSAAEAKRRKKVDKINKEFEKQLRARGIDPKTGGIIMDNKK